MKTYQVTIQAAFIPVYGFLKDTIVGYSKHDALDRAQINSEHVQLIIEVD